MYTRCPECETTFKLGVADLRRAQGKVRCGDCNFVFNALEYLAEDIEDKTEDQLPILENPVSEKTTLHPATQADPYNQLNVANDESNAAANDDHHSDDASADGATDDAEEDWTPVESNDDWQSKTSIIIERRSEPRFPSPAHEDHPTATHIRPTMENNNLPTVTMETLAPAFEEQPAEESTEQEDESVVKALNEDVDVDQAVVELPPAAEFQEPPFGEHEELQQGTREDQSAEEGWSDLSNETLKCSPEEAEAETEEPAAFAEAGQNDVDVGNEPADKVTQESAADNTPEIDDAIWEMIPGVGSSDEDWESVKTGAHKTVPDDEKLADGLSYTDAQLKVISAHNPVENYLGHADEEDESAEAVPDMGFTEAGTDEEPPSSVVSDEAAEDLSPEIENAGHSDINPDETNTAQTDDGAEEDSEKWNAFFGAEPMPEAEAVVEVEAEATPEPEIPVIESSDVFEEAAFDQAAENKVVKPQLAEENDADQAADFDDHDVKIVSEVPLDFKAFDEVVTHQELEEAATLAGITSPEGTEESDKAVSKDYRNPLMDEALGESHGLTDVTAAEHKLAGTFGDDSEPDFSSFDEINARQEPEQPESAESLMAEMTNAFDETGVSDEEAVGQHDDELSLEAKSEETVSAHPEQPADEAPELTAEEESDVDTPEEHHTNSFKKDFDPHNDTWTGLEDVEDVVMETGIFEPELIENLRAQAARDEQEKVESALSGDAPEDEDVELVPESPVDPEAPKAPPAWESEYADINPEDSTPKSSGWAWKGLLVALMIGLPIQLIHYNRDALAAHPSWGDTLRTAYSTLGMQLYPTWSLDNYEIRGHEAIAGESGEDVLDIRTEIAVVGTTSAGLPHLRVVLRDRWSNPLAASNFSPEEYAGSKDLPADGLLQPNQTVPAHVSIVDPGTGAQGYELELCLPRRDEGMICTDTPFK